MKIFKRLDIKAAKQIGTLYHLTNLDGMEFIIRDNKLRRGSYLGISFSRDKMLNFYIGSPPRTYFKLIIDGNKLSNKYKIEPYQYHTDNDDISFRQEAEELVRASEITNVDKYIKGVAFIYRNFKNDEKEYEKSNDNSLLYYGNFKVFIKSDLPDLLKRIKEKYGLYVQLGTQIKKDDAWFKAKGLL